MLVLSRKVGEAILIGENIRVVVASVEGSKIRLAIEAPDHVKILREEIVTQGRKNEKGRNNAADR